MTLSGYGLLQRETFFPFNSKHLKNSFLTSSVICSVVHIQCSLSQHVFSCCLSSDTQFWHTQKRQKKLFKFFFFLFLQASFMAYNELSMKKAEDLDCIPSTHVKLTSPLIPAPWRSDTSGPQEKVFLS